MGGCSCKESTQLPIDVVWCGYFTFLYCWHYLYCQSWYMLDYRGNLYDRRIWTDLQWIILTNSKFTMSSIR